MKHDLVCLRGMAAHRPQGLQGTPHQRHLRDGVRLDGTAGAGELSRHHHVPHGHRAGPQPHPPARRDRAAGPCAARR